jgi:hypothetical protein
MALIFFLGILTTTCWSSAAPSDTKDIVELSITSSNVASLKSPRNGVINWLFTGPLRVDLMAEPTEKFAPPCSSENLIEKLKATFLASDKTAQIASYMGACREQVLNHHKSFFEGLFGLLRRNYDLEADPRFKHVQLKFADGQILRGALGLKSKSEPKPLVILRIGVFGNVEEIMAEGFLITQLFAQADANILVLSSSSGSGYIQDNSHFNPGGLTEGLQNFAIAQMLALKTFSHQNSLGKLLSQLTTRVHMVGVSLGGHGVLHAAALESLGSKKYFDGFTLLCPVFDLQNTFKYSYSQKGFTGFAKNYWISKRLSLLLENQSIIPDSDPRPQLEIAMDWATKNNQTSKGLVKHLNAPSSWPKSFNENNLAWQLASPFKSPMVILATQTDDLVPLDLNLNKYFSILREKAKNVGFYTFEQGSHCSLPVDYKAEVIGAIMRGLANVKTIAL